MKTQNAYNAILNGNILITTVVGIINKDNTRKVFNQLKVQIPQLDGAPWGNLVDVRQWGLSSADINDSLVDLELWVRKHGRTHLVFVMGTENAGIKKFTLEQYLGNNLVDFIPSALFLACCFCLPLLLLLAVWFCLVKSGS